MVQCYKFLYGPPSRIATIRDIEFKGFIVVFDLIYFRGDVHTQVVTDNGKRPFGGVGVLYQRVISVTKWHYRNNIAKISAKQVFRKKPKKNALRN